MAPGLRCASGNLQGCAYTALAIATGKFRKRPASRKRARLQVPYREKVSFAFPPRWRTGFFWLLEIRSIFWAVRWWVRTYRRRVNTSRYSFNHAAE